jgi:hypothetical protein
MGRMEGETEESSLEPRVAVILYTMAGPGR